MIKKSIKRYTGVTLIALVVTIVILLILAGITIGAITGNNGLIGQTQSAKNSTEYKSWEEQIDIAIISAEGKNKDTKMDDIIQELINKKIINNENQVNKETGSITTNEPVYVIENKLKDYVVKYAENILKEGNYVNYIAKDGKTKLCCVLWDKSSNYGTQIITMETMEDVEIGNGTGKIGSSRDEKYFEVAKNSVNNAISMLNNKAMEYLNTEYAFDARCVGSNPSNKNSEATDYLSCEYEYMKEYNGMFKNGDDNYYEDRNQMQKLEIEYYNKDYWIASRGVVRCNENMTSIGICYIYKEDNDDRIYTMSGPQICGIHHINGCSSKSETHGLRPVFTLNNTTTIEGGEGSIENPYILGN